MPCIICDSKKDLDCIERIVPESLGNKQYVLDKVKICIKCNGRFSKIENKVLLKTFLGFERTRLGIFTKKQKPAKAQINGIEWKADRNKKKNVVEIEGLYSDSDTFKVFIPAYDNKTNEAMAKLLLKIGLEAMINSQDKIATKYVFADIKKYLEGKKNFVWPYLIPKMHVSKLFIDILKPKSKMYKHLEEIECQLSFRELGKYLLFRFNYGKFTAIICLNVFTIDWIEMIQKERNCKFIVIPEKYENLSNA